MDQRETLSLREYARRRGVALRAIQQQVESGTIRLVDGRVDPAQADASWGVIRRARMSVQDDDAGRRSARAKVAVTVAKFRFVKQRYDAAKEKYIDRSEFIQVAGAEADYVVEALRNAPATYAQAFAVELAITPELAQAILTEFMTLALAEVGDLRRQAVRDAERA
jgi:hypothetical protein